MLSVDATFFVFVLSVDTTFFFLVRVDIGVGLFACLSRFQLPAFDFIEY